MMRYFIYLFILTKGGDEDKVQTQLKFYFNKNHLLLNIYIYIYEQSFTYMLKQYHLIKKKTI